MKFPEALFSTTRRQVVSSSTEENICCKYPLDRKMDLFNGESASKIGSSIVYDMDMSVIDIQPSVVLHETAYSV